MTYCVGSEHMKNANTNIASNCKDTVRPCLSVAVYLLQFIGQWKTCWTSLIVGFFAVVGMKNRLGVQKFVQQPH
eukprot:scaffold310222_cov17-Prasinocladus_malaysianus.AAC.1